MFLCILAILRAAGIRPGPQGLEKLEALVDGQKVVLTGRVCRMTQTKNGCSVLLKNITIDRIYQDRADSGRYRSDTYEYVKPEDIKIPGSYKILVYTKTKFIEGGYGAFLTVFGEAGIFNYPENPGEFDIRSYYHSRKIILSVNDASLTLPDMQQKTSFIMNLLLRVQHALSVSLHSILDEEDAAVVGALILGEQALLPDEIRQMYTKAGIIHILAVSGLHIQLIGSSIFLMLRRRRFSYTVSGTSSMTVLVLYAAMTGCSLSCVRSVVMFGIWCLAQIFGCREDRPTSLGAALFVILTAFPYSVSDSSFWLSFGCMGSMIFAAPALAACFGPGSKADGIRGRLIYSCAVMLGTMPLICFYYYRFPLYSLLVNLIVLPIVPFLAGFGFTGALLGLASVRAGCFTASGCHFILSFYRVLCRAQSRLPFASLVIGRPSFVKITVYYILLLAALLTASRKKQRRKTALFQRTGAAALLAFGIVIFFMPSHPSFRAVFLYVGQGECILIQDKRHSYLVDCGSSSIENVWDKKVFPALAYYGVSDLDAVFVSHGDADHINGLLELLGSYEKDLLGKNCSGISVNEIIVSCALSEDEGLQSVEKAAKEKDIPVRILLPGDEVTDGDISAVCLYPCEDQLFHDSNRDSMVLHLTYDSFSLLLAGDLEGEGEDLFLEQTGGLPEREHSGAVILKASHHGSRNATSDRLLDLINPSFVVISCGLNNLYGHPAPEMIKRLSSHDIPYYRTDLDGAVSVFAGSKKTLVIRAFRQ